MQAVIFKELDNITITANKVVEVKHVGANQQMQAIRKFYGKELKSEFVETVYKNKQETIPLIKKRKHSFFNFNKKDGYCVIKVDDVVPCNFKEIYVDPIELKNKDFVFRYVSHEAGGYSPSTKIGKARIICGMNGEALIPIYIPKNPVIPYEKHAYFIHYENIPFVEIQLEHLDGKNIEFKIIRKIIQDNGDIDERILFSIDKNIKLEDIVGLLPDNYKKFTRAVNSSIKKSMIPQCMVPIYFRRR